MTAQPTMRAVLVGGRPPAAVLTTVPRPRHPAECAVRVTIAGICGTDLELLQGYADFKGVPGHEFVGIVEEAPPSDTTWVGQRVVGEINVGCDDCRFCRAGVREHCERRTVLGIRGRAGAFADYVTLPAVNLHAVPDALEDWQAVFVEPVAAACRILEQVAVGPSTRTVVVGDGRMGLLTSQVLRSTGAPVIVVGKHDDKLAVARALGFETMRDDAAARCDRGFDLAVDVTGRRSGLERALALARPRGVVVMKSTFHGAMEWTPWPAIVDEITLVGSRCGPFGPALDLLVSGQVDVGPLVAGTFPLAEFARAFERARHDLKILLSTEDGS